MYTAVVVKIDEITCRAILDNRAQSSYASSALLKKTEHNAS